MSTSRTFKSVRLVALFAAILLLLGMIGLSASWAYAVDSDDQGAEAVDVAADLADDAAVAEDEAVLEEDDAVAVDKTGNAPSAKGASADVIKSALASIIPDAAFRDALAEAIAADSSFTDADFANSTAAKAALRRFAPEGLDLSNKGITDITGINNLTAVTGFLDLSNNRINDVTPLTLDLSAGNPDTYYKCQFNLSGNPINRWPRVYDEDDEATYTYNTTYLETANITKGGIFSGTANYLYSGETVEQNVYYDVTTGGQYVWQSNSTKPRFINTDTSRFTGDFTSEDHVGVDVTVGDEAAFTVSARTKEWAYLAAYGTGLGAEDKITNTYQWTLGTAFYIPVIQDITVQDLKGIIVTKIDGSTNEPMPGIEFTLYSDAECTQAIGQAKTTDGNGVVKWDGLPAGTYYLMETVPEGYTPDGPNPLPVTIETADYGDINNMTGGVDSVTVNHSGDAWVADWANWTPSSSNVNGDLILDAQKSSTPQDLTSTTSTRYAKVGADNDIAFGITSASTDQSATLELTMGGQTAEVASVVAASEAVNAYIKAGDFVAADADGIKLVGALTAQLGEDTFTEVTVTNNPVAYRMKKERVTDAPEAVDPDKTGYGFWAGDTVTYKITVENLCGAVLTMDVADSFIEDNGSFENLKYTKVQAASGDVAWLNEDEAKDQGTIAPSIQLGPNAVAEVYVTAQVAADAEEWLATAEKDHVPARDDMWNYTDPTAAAEAEEEQSTAVDSNDDGYVNKATTTNVVAYKYDETAPDGRGTRIGTLQDDDDYANTPVQVVTPSYTMEKYRESLAPIKQPTEEGYGFYVGNTVTYKGIVTNTCGMDLTLDVSDKFDEGNFSTPKVTGVKFFESATGTENPACGSIKSVLGRDTVKITIKPGAYAEVTFTAEVKDNPEYLAPDESDFRGSDKVSGDGYQNTITTSDVVATLEFEDSSTGQSRTITMTKDDTDALADMTDTADTPVQVPQPDYIMSKCRVTDAPEKESDPDHYGFFKGDEATYEVTVTNTGDMDLTMNVSDKFNEGSFSTPKVTGVKFYETDGMVESDDFGSVKSALGKDNVDIELKIGGTAVVTYTANVRQNREYLAPTTDDKKDNAKDGYLNTATTSNVVASVTYTNPDTGEQATFTQKLEKKTDTANTPVQKTEEIVLTGDSSTLLFTGGLLVGFALLFLAISRTTGNSFAGATSFIDGVSAKPSRNRAQQAPIEAVSRSTHQRRSRKNR